MKAQWKTCQKLTGLLVLEILFEQQISSNLMLFQTFFLFLFFCGTQDNIF